MNNLGASDKKTVSQQYLCSSLLTKSIIVLCAAFKFGMCISLAKVRLSFIYSMPSNTVDMIATLCCIHWRFHGPRVKLNDSPVLWGSTLMELRAHFLNLWCVVVLPLLVFKTALTHAAVSTNLCAPKHRRRA